MRKPDSVKKTKSIKKAESYETIPEDTKRRKAIPVKDVGEFAEVFVGRSRDRGHLNRCMAVLHEVYIYLRRNHMVVAFLGLIVGVWLSGWFAQSGMRFESLLSLVVGFIFLLVVGMWSTK